MTQLGLAAVTGGTGFLGRYIVRTLADMGWRVRLLVRRDPLHPQLAGISPEIVLGGLDDDQALRRLCAGANVVIHAAGLIKALRRSDFFRVNADGTARLAAVARQTAPGARFLLVSSLAAREPHLSHYAASKRAAETALAAEIADFVIARPAAVYGPWDLETLTLFQAAARRVLASPRSRTARIGLIHAADAAEAIIALCHGGARGKIYELTDARVSGYTWPEIAAEAARAVATSPRLWRLPDSVWRLAGATSGAAAALRRRPAMLTLGKAREILHEDWGANPQRCPPSELWRPRIDLATGFAETAKWYRINGCLPREGY